MSIAYRSQYDDTQWDEPPDGPSGSSDEDPMTADEVWDGSGVDDILASTQMPVNIPPPSMPIPAGSLAGQNVVASSPVAMGGASSTAPSTNPGDYVRDAEAVTPPGSAVAAPTSTLQGISRDLAAQQKAMPASTEAEVKAADTAIEGEKAANTGLAETEQEKANALYRQAEQNAAAADLAAAKAQNREVERQATLDAMATDMADAEREVVNMKVDPNRLLRPIGNKILAGIGMALGSLGSAITHGPNVAAETINRAIERDIESQRDDIQNKRAGLAGQQSMYGRMLQRFGDERTADAVLHASEIARAQNQLALEAAKYASPEIQKRAAIANAALETKKAEYKATAMKVQSARYDQNAALQIQANVPLVEAGVRQANATATEEKNGPVPGLKGTSKTPKDREAAVLMKGQADSLLTQLKDLKTLIFGGFDNAGKKVEGTGREMFPTDIAKQAQAMAQSIRLELGKGLMQLGVLSKDDYAALDQLIPPDPTQMNQGAVKTQLEQAEAYIKARLAAELKVRGYSGYTPTYTADAR